MGTYIQADSSVHEVVIATGQTKSRRIQSHVVQTKRNTYTKILIQQKIYKTMRCILITRQNKDPTRFQHQRIETDVVQIYTKHFHFLGTIGEAPNTTKEIYKTKRGILLITQIKDPTLLQHNRRS